MKDIRVKYTFTATKTIRVPDDADENDIEMEAQQQGDQMEFCLEGMTTMEFRILE